MQENELTQTEAKPESSSMVSTILWTLGFLALGFIMIKYPDAVADDRPRKTIGKLLVWVWGKPAGIVAMVIGALILSSSFLGNKKES